jgi:hypothetical protein
LSGGSGAKQKDSAASVTGEFDRANILYTIDQWPVTDVRDYRKIVIFGATGTIGKAVVAELLPKYEVLKVGNRQGQFKADFADADSIRNVFQAIGQVDGIRTNHFKE